MSRDTIGDFLTIIRNGVLVGKRFVTAPYSKMRDELAQVLKNEGFIRDVQVTGENPYKKELKVFLKYVDGESVIHEITRISTPGCREYTGAHGIKPVIGGLGVSILTTSSGIMTHHRAKTVGVGGEVLCTVW